MFRKRKDKIGKVELGRSLVRNSSDKNLRSLEWYCYGAVLRSHVTLMNVKVEHWKGEATHGKSGEEHWKSLVLFGFGNV